MPNEAVVLGQFKAPTFSEKLMSFIDKDSRYIKRNVRKDFNIVAVLESPGMGKNGSTKKRIMYADALPEETRIETIKKWIRGMNLVTNDGDQYYAERSCGQTPAVPFQDANGRMELGNGAQPTPNKTNTYSALASPIAASRKALNAGYPKTNDADPDNTGSGIRIASWLTSWTKADFNAVGITGGVIHDAAGSPVAGSLLLTFWTITAFDKTADDTLKIFVNHQFLGV